MRQQGIRVAQRDGQPQLARGHARRPQRQPEENPFCESDYQQYLQLAENQDKDYDLWLNKSLNAEGK